MLYTYVKKKKPPFFDEGRKETEAKTKTAPPLGGETCKSGTYCADTGWSGPSAMSDKHTTGTHTHKHFGAAVNNVLARFCGCTSEQGCGNGVQGAMHAAYPAARWQAS
jgi:hypothetical protein